MYNVYDLFTICVTGDLRGDDGGTLRWSTKDQSVSLFVCLSNSWRKCAEHGPDATKSHTLDPLMTGLFGGFAPETNQKLTRSSRHKMSSDSRNQTVGRVTRRGLFPSHSEYKRR